MASPWPLTFFLGERPRALWALLFCLLYYKSKTTYRYNHHKYADFFNGGQLIKYHQHISCFAEQLHVLISVCTFLYARLKNGTYYGNTGGWVVRRAASTGFLLSKSKSFHSVFINLGEYVVGHNISTKFYNLQNPPGTPKLWPLNCPKLVFPLSKSKSFCPVLFKLGNYVGGHNISTKFYNQPNPPCTPELWPLNSPK